MVKLQKPEQAVWYSIVVILVTVIAVAVGNILYTNWVDRRSNQLWCEILVGIDDLNTKRPPQSEESKDFANKVHKLVIEFHCRSLT